MFQKTLAKKPCKCKQIRSDKILASVGVLKHCIITWYISRWSTGKVHWDVQTTLAFDISKSYEKEISKQPRCFVFQKHINRSTSRLYHFSIEIAKKNSLKQRQFFVHRNYVEKGISKKCWFSAHWNYVKQSPLKRPRLFAHLKLHRKSTSKWHGNLSMFSFWHIIAISTSNRTLFDVVCPLRRLRNRYIYCWIR